ncbi:MAG: hypothetical protein HQ593_01470 [Candidatus Omnitrophica bacterium]|nr:hypothetical protein [Candidatus Omnitrophota bacterium]
MVKIIVSEKGSRDFLKRISDPFFFR